MAGRKKVRVYRRIAIDSSEAYRRVEAAEFQEVLGPLEPVRHGELRGSPYSIAAIRGRLSTELASSGGRPARQRVVTIKKIPLTEAESVALKQITHAVRTHGVNATTGQVAGVLLHQSMSEVLAGTTPASPSSTSPPAHSLAELKRQLEEVVLAAANATEQLEHLRPVALELLEKMKAGRGVEDEAL